MTAWALFRSLIRKRVRIPYERVAVNGELLPSALPQSADTSLRKLEKTGNREESFAFLSVQSEDLPRAKSQSHEPTSEYRG